MGRFWAVFAALTLLFSGTVLGQASTGLSNPDFEEGKPGQVPAGWFVPPMLEEQGYRVEVAAEEAVSGEQCARMWYAGAGPATGFGNVIQTFRADGYRGKRVRFRAAVRMDGAGAGRGQLWLRVDREGNRRGFFENMGDRPITSDAWEHYEIMGEVEPDAEWINIGCMLVGTGQVWIDDVSFEVVGAVVRDFQASRPIEGRGLENLAALSRLAGYVRHFHPSDQAAAADWDRLTISAVRYVEDARSAGELADRLTDIFAAIAPTVRVFETGGAAATSPFSPRAVSGLQVARWEHYGFGSPGSHSIYSSTRVYHPSAEEAAAVWSSELGGGVSCHVPLAVYADEQGTLPRVAGPTSRPAWMVSEDFRISGQDRSTRLAAVILGWNVLEHSYPYFEVVGTDWQAVLPEALASAANDGDEQAFCETLRRMVAKLRDGHGGVIFSRYGSVFVPPVELGWVEDRIVVSRVDAAEVRALRPGDVVEAVDGVKAEELLGQKEELVSAATDAARRRLAAWELLSGLRDSPVEVRVRRGSGEAIVESLKRSVTAQWLWHDPRRPGQMAEVRPGVYYLDINTLTGEQFNQALARLEKAKGIVIDFRGYPQIDTSIISHLIDGPVTCAQWHVPAISKPDRTDMGFQFSNWPVAPIGPKLTAKVAFITDSRAISYAETYLGMVEHYRLGEIVGEPTAGTNGNVNVIDLPGGYRITFTGMKVLKQDGSRHHGVGIRPTVPVGRTVEGVRDGRDELLEKAVAVVEGQ